MTQPIQPLTPSSPEAPSPFSPTLPKFQLAWDSTSLGYIKDCPRLYQYSILEQWTPRSKGVHLLFGGWYASGVERYAHYIAEGTSHDDACLKMISWALEVTGTRDEDGTFTPWPGDEKYPEKTRETLIRSLLWNVEERHQFGRYKTLILANGKPAVELSFRFEAFEIAGEPILLCGHMDEVLELDGILWVKDDKTTKGALNAQYFKQYTPHNQMSLYAIAGQVAFNMPVQGVIIRAAQIGVNFTRFATAMAPRPKAVLEEWLVDTRHWITLARHYAEQDHWPMNDKSCDKFGGCPFRSICSVSPSHRQAHLAADFSKREWNPLAVRGDI